MSIKSRVLTAFSLLGCLATAWSQPAFLFEPENVTASPGANVLFQCIAFGDGPITYQWYKGTQEMGGQTSDFLSIANVTVADAGDYLVVASTFSGSVTSAVAVLTIEGSFIKVTSGPLVNDLGSSLPAAWGDYDNDGFPDVFIPKAGTDFNYLYHNNGDGSFSRILTGLPVTEYVNSRAAVWADYDNDGRLDLLVVNSGIGGGGGFGGPPGTNSLFRNNGDGTFSRPNAGEALGVEGSVGTSAAWADYDRDGFLDLCVGININPNAVYRNNRDGTFVRVQTGPIATESFKSSSSLAWGDYNNDGAPDLLVANQNIGTFIAGNENFYRNLGDGSFARVNNNVSTSAGASLSASWADYDNDGDLDLFVVNYGGQNSPLFQNNGDGTFTAIASGELVNAGSEGANTTSATWGDYDNDGWLDVFVTNDGAIGNFLFHNNDNGTLTRLQAGSVTEDRANSFGCSWVDVNRDGFLDLFVANVSGENYLYRNAGNSHGWINVQLKGEISNRSGVGAKVRVLATINGVSRWQMREIGARDGSGSPNTIDAHVGLGDATQIQTLRIEWPSGIVQELQNVGINQFLTISEPPSIRISGVSRVEGDEGQHKAFLTLTLTQPTNAWVTVDYFTADRDAVAGSDYLSDAGTVSFAPNQTTQTLSVTLLGDLLDETNETFLVTLTNSTVLPIVVRDAMVTIIDDEPLTLSIADASAPEVSGGVVGFAVNLLKPVNHEVTVDFATSSGIAGNVAASGIDFIGTNGTLQFAPGETNKIISVPLLSDAFDEADEIFVVNLTNVVNAIMIDAQGIGTILDNDPFPIIRLTSTNVYEGDTGTRQIVLEANLSEPSGIAASIQYATSNLTAFAGLDYTFALGTLTFEPGVTNKTITVSITGDTTIEGNEAFYVNLFNANRLTIGARGDVVVLDDDFKVLTPVMTPGGFRLSFTSTTGRNYRVEWTDELTNSTQWRTLPGNANVAGTGGVIQITDTTGAPDLRRFYRVILLQ